MRLVLAASTVWPWLAMSNSGQRATYWSSSRWMIAVSWRMDFIARGVRRAVHRVLSTRRKLHDMGIDEKIGSFCQHRCRIALTIAGV
jgi:hypothetical protein